MTVILFFIWWIWVLNGDDFDWDINKALEHLDKIWLGD